MDSTSELSTPFPLPPIFYKKYTAENWEKIAPHLSKYGVEISNKPLLDSTPPLEIDLLPPPIPENCTEYMVFGRTYKLEEDFPSLKELGINLYYTNFEEQDLIKELRGLNKLVLEQFLEIIQHIADVPAAEESGSELEVLLDKLNLSLVNMMHMANRLRPSQARATLHHILEKRRLHFQTLASSAYKTCSDIMLKAKDFQCQNSNDFFNESSLSTSKSADTSPKLGSSIANSFNNKITYIDDDPHLERLLNSVL